METEVNNPTEETVVNENEDKVVEDSTEEVITETAETNEEPKSDGKFIPRSRFNEVISQKNELKSKIDELNEQLASVSSANEDTIKTFQSQIDELKSGKEIEVKEMKQKYEATLYQNSGAEDVEYLKFLAEKKTSNGIDLESAINELKEEKPNLFVQNRKSVGGKPTNNNAGKVSQAEFSTITDRKEKMRLIKEGLVLND